MEIKEAQLEMRSTFLGGFAGQLVSGVIWLIAAGISFFVRPLYGMAVLFFGSMFIFPLTQVLIRALGRPGKTSKDNSLWPLGAQTADFCSGVISALSATCAKPAKPGRTRCRAAYWGNR